MKGKKNGIERNKQIAEKFNFKLSEQFAEMFNLNPSNPLPIQGGL